MSKRPRDVPAGEITPEALYLRRREFLKNAALFAGTASAVGSGLLWLAHGARPSKAAAPDAPLPEPVAGGEPPPAADGGPPRVYTVDEPRTPFDDVTSYNNFYELGLDKGDPAENAGALRTRPWTVSFSGEIKRAFTADLDTLLGWFPREERVYRMRCVEAWSMVIPWLGFPLAALIQRLEPTSAARYVAFRSVLDPEHLPGQRSRVLPWPYVEGLRLDEAMSPLAFLAMGLYGRALPGQNGAPLRLVTPWKYGFKGIKSIVEIRLTAEPPLTTWNRAAPREYGFYANVNPAVDHPRWSQATERRIGELKRRPTLPFNGYASDVAALYAGLDLRENF